MAEGSALVRMTGREKVLGGGLLAAYLAALPASGLIGHLAGVSMEEGLGDAVRYGVLFLLALAVFGGYFRRSAGAFLDHIGRTAAAAGTGLAALCVLSGTLYRILQPFFAGGENLNDRAVLAQLEAAPGRTILTVVLLSPVVEEAVFRGYVFGNLRERSRPAAYLASCLLFAYLHVGQFAAAYRDPSYLPVMAQYLIPGAVLAWTFERSGTLWGSVLLHSAVNGLSVWRILGGGW